MKKVIVASTDLANDMMLKIAIDGVFQTIVGEKASVDLKDIKPYLKLLNSVKKDYKEKAIANGIDFRINSLPLGEEMFETIKNHLDCIALVCENNGIEYDYLVVINNGHLNKGQKHYHCVYAGIRNKLGHDETGISSYIELPLEIRYDESKLNVEAVSNALNAHISKENQYKKTLKK